MPAKEKKSDMVEYVTKMAERMSPRDLAEMVSEFDPAKVTRLLTADLEKPGPEICPGEANVVRYEDLLNEAIVPPNNLLPVHFMQEGAVVQRAVCRINVPRRRIATGFMVSKSLMLTNHHVLPDLPTAVSALAEFNYQSTYTGNLLGPDPYSLNPDAVFYTNAALDFTLVRVRPKLIWFNQVPVTGEGTAAQATAAQNMTVQPPVLPDYSVFPGPDLDPHFAIPTDAGISYGWLKLRRTITYALGDYLNIIGHPAGRRKEVALQENNLTAVYANMIHYTTDSEPGSSGSPVFDNNWDLMALHRGTGNLGPNGVWIDNEGIRIDRIAADLVAHYTARPGGAIILTELGL